ncbi:hypothetical protein NDU88_001977 [Pleurodeles waltl]|uniref:Uncharacterized protein n=1 Tax=Pleurodeles waltl TaxID=8319 RepID=A0AAV7WPB9_PLEWA|nr:hypothetical protein NDU88_001977 [Pleurodeles waltl]
MDRMSDKHTERDDMVERRELLTELLGDIFVMEEAYWSLVLRLLPGAIACPIVAHLLNYRAGCKAKELKVLPYEGIELPFYPDFTQQVQDVLKQFIPAKQKLQELQLEYSMLYPA